jgi:Mrp family chromosome partitioning ATPase
MPDQTKGIQADARLVQPASLERGGDFDLDLSNAARDAEPRLQVIGDIHPKPSAIAATAALSFGPVAEEFRMLAARVRVLDSERALRCFGIVSAVGGEGKSTVALGLANALAREAGGRVLLVEADLRRSTLDTYLDLPAVSGLSEWLGGNPAPLRLRRVLPTGFFLLSAGRSLKRSGPEGHYADLLGSLRMRVLIDCMRRNFDFCLLDCPPLVPVADSFVLQEMLDGFLFVVRERRAPAEAVVRSLDRLKPEKVRGVIFNDHSELLPRYSKYAYTYYGNRR